MFFVRHKKALAAFSALLIFTVLVVSGGGDSKAYNAMAMAGVMVVFWIFEVGRKLTARLRFCERGEGSCAFSTPGRLSHTDWLGKIGVFLNSPENLNVFLMCAIF